jgi:tRNA threonylcarbamoyladenosine biosynthesis protein TsaE
VTAAEAWSPDADRADRQGEGIIEVTTRSVAETRALAGRIQPLLRPGDLLLLGGDLGAGKTAFVQGLAAAMGITEAVTSPTFTLIREYELPAGGRLLHADMYRLDHLQEVEELGLAEFVDDGDVAAVEWGQAAAPVLPGEHLEIRLDFGAADDERVVRFAPHGHRWAGFPAALHQARAGERGTP